MVVSINAIETVNFFLFVSKHFTYHRDSITIVLVGSYALFNLCEGDFLIKNESHKFQYSARSSLFPFIFDKTFLNTKGRL